MKNIILMIIMFFISSTLSASTETYGSRQLGYASYKPDTFSSGLLSMQLDGYDDLEFKLGMSKGLKRLRGDYHTDSNLVRRVVVWMSYKF